MIIKTEDYSVETSDENKAKLSGSMRLPSPIGYNEPFSNIKKGIEETNKTYCIDIQELNYLNSSGITSLARLVILARKLNKSLTITANKSIPWQKRSIQSLTHLWENLSLIYK